MQVVVIENRQRITGYVERIELEACQAFPSFNDAIAYLEHQTVDVVLYDYLLKPVKRKKLERVV